MTTTEPTQETATVKTGARAMFRYEVPLTPGWTYFLTGDPVCVANSATNPLAVEFWAEHTEGAPSRERTFQVFGTGHPLPPGARYVGTAPRTRDGLVWHLYEIVSDEAGELSS